MSRRQEKKVSYGDDDNSQEANIRDLDTYLEMLYEVSGQNKQQAESQIIGTQKILSLCRHVPNLEQLIQNNTVMGALTRVLQEEYKKSVDVTFNILRYYYLFIDYSLLHGISQQIFISISFFRIFLAFSNFSEMHNLMGDYRMGALTMKTIEYEMKRLELLNSEAREREIFYSNEIKNLKSNRELNDEDSKTVLSKLKKDKKKELDKHMRKKRKHEKVLFVSFYILLNLVSEVVVV